MARKMHRTYVPLPDVRVVRHEAQQYLNAQKILTMIYKSSLPHDAKAELRAQALGGDIDGAMDAMKRMLMEG